MTITRQCDWDQCINILVVYIQQANRMNNGDQNRQMTANRNRKIIFIICIYLLLILTSRYTPDNYSLNTEFISAKMAQPDSTISLVDALSIVDKGVVYEGKWKQLTSPLQSRESGFLGQKEGTFKIQVYPETNYNSIYYSVGLRILDGDYIDNGILTYYLALPTDKFAAQRNNQKEATTYYNHSLQMLTANYRKDKILFTLEQGELNVTSFKFTFVLTDAGVDVKLSIITQQVSLQLSIVKPQNKSNQIYLLAILTFLCSYVPFKAILSILKAIYQLQDNTRKYSFITIMLTNMWDTVLCIVCFIFSFRDQQSLMLFIIPAFLLCLMFTNLQPRFLIAIYQNAAGNGLNIRQIICRFNLIHYGSLFMIYPIILLTNFNWVFFIAMSCIVFPQIYTNAFVNLRPEINSVYYTQYLFSRFVIIFYLKCFPYNNFGFKPDYVLSSVCLVLILIQYGLLFMQKVYGSKKILPSFLLQPVFNYKLDEQVDIQEGGDHHECSICLTPLHTDPPHDPNNLQHEPKFRLMKTPCNHSYHSRCLMVWMNIKMECPECRFKLPPYQ